VLSVLNLIGRSVARVGATTGRALWRGTIATKGGALIGVALPFVFLTTAAGSAMGQIIEPGLVLAAFVAISSLVVRG
jgi:hypothetical protein